MHSLRNRLLVRHLLPALIFFPLVGFVLIQVVETQLFLPNLSQELTDKAILMREIARDTPAIWQDATAADKFIQRFYQDADDQLMLLAPDGHLLASSDPAQAALVGQVLRPAGLAGLQGEAVQAQISYDLAQQAEMIEILAPVVDAQQQVVGVMRITYLPMAPYSYFQRARYLIILILAVALILRLLLGLLLSRSLERPLIHLTEAIEQLMQGKTVALPERGTTELRVLARAFNGLTRRLRLLEASRQQLLANLIHELRRPLGALNSAIHALLHGASDDPALRTDLLTGIQAELRRLHRLVDDLALLYTQTLGTLELDRHPTALAAWLPSVLGPWREAAQQKGLTWRVDGLAGLPTLAIDADRLAQALGNLLSNAVKFTPDGGAITLTGGRTGESCWLRVSDTGSGIAPEEQARIFEPFYRSHTTHLFPEGMGLGLPIAHDLVFAHGGRLTVESSLGAGSHFTIWLPLPSPQTVPQPVNLPTAEHSPVPQYILSGSQSSATDG